MANPLYCQMKFQLGQDHAAMANTLGDIRRGKKLTVSAGQVLDALILAHQTVSEEMLQAMGEECRDYDPVNGKLVISQ